MDQELYDRYSGYLDYKSETKIRYFSTHHQHASNTWLSQADVSLLMPRLDLQSLPENIRIQSDPFLNAVLIPGTGVHEPLHIQEDELSRMLVASQIPPAFVQTALANNGHFAHFVQYASNTEKPEFLSTVMKSPHSPLGSFTCATRPRLSDRSTVCVLFWENEKNVKVVTERLQLRRDKLIKSPLHLITVLVEEYSRIMERWRHNLDCSLVEMEKYIGKTGFDTDPLTLPEDDYEELIKDLQTLNTSLIWLDHMTKFEHELGKFGSTMVNLCETLRKECGNMGLSPRILEELDQTARFHLNDCEFRRYQGNGLQNRAQTQISLLYSQMARRDTRLNLSVAQNSRQIASSTLRDSRAMKTIAVLTLLFLPATLIASIYDAGIIDLQAERITVPKLWWTYPLAAIILTTLILGTWTIWMRTISSKNHQDQEKDIEKQS